MAPLSRWERLQLAALRLREIQSEAAAIYRSFPELDRRPKINRTAVRTKPDNRRSARSAIWPAKLH
jgi:hypothetical protein